MIPAWITIWISRNAVMAGLIAGLIATGLMWDRGRIAAAEQRGAIAVKSETEKANAKVIERARSVRARSRAAGVRGAVVDPHYIDN